MTSLDGIIAVVPARGGSKRIPHKNIRPFLGIPLLARTIASLQSTALFEGIIVSTDDEEIASVARDAGADVPFLREESLASDTASTVPVIRDAVERLASAGRHPRIVCAVYPAAVFISGDDLRAAIALRESSRAEYVIPVTSFPCAIQRSLRLELNGAMAMFQPEHYNTRSQDLEPAFHDAGQFYLGTREAWLEERPLFTDRSRALRLPRHRVQDIDTLEDWKRAELMFQLLQRHEDPHLTTPLGPR